MIVVPSPSNWAHAALSQLPLAVLVFDARGLVALANHAAATLLAQPLDQLVGSDVLALAGAPGIVDIPGDETIAELIRSTWQVESDVSAIRDTTGDVVGIVAVLHEPRGERGDGESFQRFIERAPDPITIVRDGRVLFANPAVLRLLDYSLDEVVGRPIEEFIHPDDLSAIRERVAAARAGKKIPIRENTFVGRGGRVLRMEVSSMLMTYRGRSAVVSIGRDVTEQRLVEAERAHLLAEVDAQRTLFKTVFDKAPAGIAILGGDDFRFEMVNAAFQQFAPGFTLEGQRFADVAPEMQEIVPILEKVMFTGEPERARAMELKIRRTPGGPLETGYFTFAIVRVSSLIGRHLAILGMVVEATEEVRAHARADAQAELARRRAAELDAVIRTMCDGVFVCDRTGALTLANPAGLELLGVGSLGEANAALSEQPKLTRVCGADGVPLRPDSTPLARALTGAPVLLASETVRRPDRTTTFVRANATPIRDDEGTITGAVEVARDVTELEEFDRLKDQFIRVAAHELKTPVAIMKGYAQALLRKPNGVGPTARGMLEAIDRGAERLDRTVRKLLDVSTLHLGRLALTSADVDVGPLIRRLAERLAPQTIRHRIRVEVQGPVVARADAARLEYVFACLLDNAIKYSPAADRVDVLARSDDRAVIVSIQDYGVGIPRERQGHVFERFYRAHTDTPHDYGGMGIDLYLSREVVARMDGRMWFESVEGSGTTFFVALPKGERDR